MTETADELSAPLGQTEKRRRRRIRLPFTLLQALAVLLGLFLVVFAGFALFGDNPLGGEPIARIAINAGAKPDDKSGAAKPDAKHGATAEHGAAAPAKQDGGDRKTVTIIDGSSGARQEVAIGGGGSETAEPGAAAPAASQMPGVDPRLLEKSRYGMIPVMADGVKPFTAYAA